MTAEDQRRARALSSIRLSDHELVGLAELADRATHYATSASSYPYQASEEERVKWEQEEKEARAQEARERESALLELRAWVEGRETDAYLRGVDATTSSEARSGYNTRSLVLLAVVLAVVAMPILAIVLQLDPERFGSYIAPVTGIAGTVVGYWFSSVGRSDGTHGS